MPYSVRLTFVAAFHLVVLVQMTPLSATQTVTLVEAFPNLRFDSPVFLAHSPDGTNRIFVVEQRGAIKVFPNDPGVTAAEIFLDIDARVTSGGEMGLLGLAFHPDFANNGFFYVNYTTTQAGPRRTVITRYSVSANNANAADPNSEFILLEIEQPFSNHNAGMLQFGNDGFLYIAVGDGGSGGDPLNHGQNRGTLLGSILRIDVDNPSGGRNYGIPADNPFVGNNQGFREEIWAYGLRNPWRFSIDPVTNQLWAGDVGQSAREEIDLIERGGNYGWRIMEGTLCFNPSSNCDRTGLTLPIKDYPRSLGQSVTGGYVYRGQARPEFTGAYIYADFITNRVWLLRYENGSVIADSLLLRVDAANFGIASFGLDEAGELYMVDLLGGALYRFSSNPATDVAEAPRPVAFELLQNYPNPFNPSTTIRYRLARAAQVELAIFNAAGQRVRTFSTARQPAGEHAIQWDGQNEEGHPTASGVYLYVLRVGDVRQSRKMLFLK